MKLIKSIMSAFAIVLATTACAGNSGENKKSNEPTKKENKMEVIALNKADFLKKVYNYEANPDRKSTRLNSSHSRKSRMPSSA